MMCGVEQKVWLLENIRTAKWYSTMLDDAEFGIRPTVHTFNMNFFGGGGIDTLDHNVC